MQKLFYLPEAHTDFVFAVIAEEFGLVGSVVLIALVRRRSPGARSRSRARRRCASAGTRPSVAFGFAVWQAVQVFINIGVNMGILPTKGLTLPLVSYGRSSMLVTLLGFGLLLRIDLENRHGNGGAARRRAAAERRVTA